MGWTGCMNYEGYTPKEYWKKVLLPEIEHWSSETPGCMKIVAENSYGKEFYAAVHDSRKNKTWALIVLIVKDRKTGEICYKDMDETCHPFYYNASASVLNALSPTDNENSNEWRKQCREEKKRKYEKKKRLDSLQNGMKLRFKNGYKIAGKSVHEFTLKSKRFGYFSDEYGTYRLCGWKSNPFEIVA